MGYEKKYENSNNLNFIIGDIRDKSRIQSSLSEDIDYVVHAAAAKLFLQQKLILRNVLKQI